MVQGMRTALLAAYMIVQVLGFRLPGDVIPIHYDLTFAFDLDDADGFPFFGLASMEIKAIKDTTKIILHVKNLTIENDKILLLGERNPIIVNNAQIDNSVDFLTLHLDGSLEEKKQYTLVIPFSGNLNDGLEGAYISSYVDSKTKVKENLIATYFEPTNARKAFPCFDEPMYKATFKIRIAHDRAYTALSNMPLSLSTDFNEMEDIWAWANITQKFHAEKTDYVWDEFEVSKPMSTYLVAFVVSNFTHVESPAGLSRTKFRIWARRDAKNQMRYASIIGPKIQTYFEHLFNLSYPLPKQDMVAVPDFSIGGMENWGLILYSEYALLLHDDSHSIVNKAEIASLVAHEISHQWFGNLVTMKWWSDLWLKEGFACYLSSLGMQHVEPKIHASQFHAVLNVLNVLSVDSLEFSHPVQITLDNPNRISEVFDAISYSKGQLLIRMMIIFLGEDVFWKAVNNFLVKYSYGNADQDYLWRELTAVAVQFGVMTQQLTVKEIMDTWTTQAGYPLITVQRNYNDKTIIITQKRYKPNVINGSFHLSRSKVSTWWVPLKLVCQNDTAKSDSEPMQWLQNQQEAAIRTTAEPDEWIVFNADFMAPCRINYDDRNWKLIIALLNSVLYKDIPEMSRVQLTMDSMELAWSNVIEYSTALKLINYLQNETEYLPFMAAMSQLWKIDNVLKRDPDYGFFQKFTGNLVSAAYKRGGGLYSKTLNSDDFDRVKMQILMCNWACSMKVSGCEENAISLFQTWMKSNDPDKSNPIPVDLRPIVYRTAVSRGSVEHWRFLLARKKKAPTSSERTCIIKALAHTRETWILKQYLQWTVEKNSVLRRYESNTVMSIMLGTPDGYFVAKEFIYNQIADIFSYHNNDTKSTGYLAQFLLEQFTTQKELDEFTDWLKAKTKYFDTSQFAVQQGFERARANIDWSIKNKDRLIELLKQMTTTVDQQKEARHKLQRTSASSTNSVQHLIKTFLWCAIPFCFLL